MLSIRGPQALGWEGVGYDDRELAQTRDWLRFARNTIEADQRGPCSTSSPSTFSIFRTKGPTPLLLALTEDQTFLSRTALDFVAQHAPITQLRKLRRLQGRARLLARDLHQDGRAR